MSQNRTIGANYDTLHEKQKGGITMQYLITGTTRGIGLGLVKEALKRNHRVIAAGRNLNKAIELIRLKNAHPNVLKLYELDVSNDKDIDSFKKELYISNPIIDVLINSAGINREGSLSFEKTTTEGTQEVLNVNILGPVRVSKVILPLMVRSSKPCIINISSVLGSISNGGAGPNHYAYCISKAGLNMFTKILSQEYPHIICMSMHPGWVKTDLGGLEAPVSVEESTRGILDQIESFSIKQSGRFFDFKGKELSW